MTERWIFLDVLVWLAIDTLGAMSGIGCWLAIWWLL